MFKKIKEYTADTMILAKLVPREKLFLYLAISETALSSVLVSINYVSQAPNETKQRYPLLEKLAYILVMSVRKLRVFFRPLSQSFDMLPLQNALHRPDTAGCCLKWLIKIWHI